MIRSLVLALVTVLSLTAAAQACRHGCVYCAPESCCEPCAYQTVERVVLVPQYYRERKTIQMCETRPEPYQRPMTVLRPIAESHQELRDVCTIVPTRTMHTEHYTVCRPVYRTVRQERTVMVPHEEPVASCKNCGGAGCGQCTHVVCRPEVQVHDVRVCDWVYEEKTRDVECVEMVRHMTQKEVTVTTMRYEPEQKMLNCIRMMPVMVDKVVEVPGCRMVEQRITCRVPVCAGCGF